MNKTRETKFKKFKAIKLFEMTLFKINEKFNY